MFFVLIARVMKFRLRINAIYFPNLITKVKKKLITKKSERFRAVLCVKKLYSNQHYSILKMENDDKLSRSIIPFVSRRTLLFVAASVWFFAGGMLITRGIAGVVQYNNYLIIKLITALISGKVFYWFMFRRISGKHIRRIVHQPNDRLPVYSFFNSRSYLMMGMMISLGVMLRKTGVVPFQYLSVFYVAMGLPLVISAFRFLYHGINFTGNL